jgi:ABC-type lipoprotein release transport system permease subunit
VLKVSVGDEVALISQGADGSVANDLLRVVGIVGTGDGGYGSMNCYLHIQTAREFLSLDGRTHEIAVVLTDHTWSRKAAGMIDGALDEPGLDVQPWQVVESQFYRAMMADIKGNWISIGVFTLIVAVGVLNTVLMVILERTREYGVIKAIGTRPVTVFRMIVTETAFLALMSIVVGLAVGAALNYWLSVHGILLSTPVEWGGVMFERITSKVTFRSIYMPAAIILTTAVVVSAFPALRAARIVPVRALRAG